MSIDSAKERYLPVSLSFNIGGMAHVSEIGDLMSCNSGGSVICNAGTGGCGQGGMTCVGTSCSGKSATLEMNFDARILVEHAMIDKLKSQLQKVVAEFAR